LVSNLVSHDVEISGARATIVAAQGAMQEVGPTNHVACR
jgi:hypothetical protein